MLTLRQSPFDLFERLEQQLATAERVPNAEIHETEIGYTVQLELPGVDRDSIDVKATDRNLVISAERPSRLTAPNSERAERSNALGQAKRLDAVQNYRGIRISRKGRRFMINKARIWTLWDADERACGQAACFSDWWWL